MNPDPLTPHFSLHIERGADSEHAVAASVLVQVLGNAQRAFELIGSHVEGRTIKQRARIAATTSRRFELVCGLPAPGCYAVPISFADFGDDLLLPSMHEQAVKVFRCVLEGIAAKDSETVEGAIPDQRLLRRVLEAVKGMAPRPDARWSLALHDAEGNPLAVLGRHAVPFVETMLVPAEQRESARTVTGELKSIDFAARRMSIIYPPTSQLLDCFYDEEIEDLLYENRRELIQVTGRVLLDDQGNPKQIIDVSDIRDLDLSPLVIDALEHDDSQFVFRSPLCLVLAADETRQFLFVEHAPLGIDVFANTRDGLMADLAQQVAMLWREYALASDETLDPAAQGLKRAILAAIEVRDAA